MRHHSAICSMCSCFLDGIQTSLDSNQLKQIDSFPPPSQENLKEAPRKKPPNPKSYLKVNDARFWLASKGLYAIVDWLYVHMWKHVDIRKNMADSTNSRGTTMHVARIIKWNNSLFPIWNKVHPRANKITLIFAPATTFQNTFTPLTLSRHEEYLAGEKEPSIFFFLKR